MTDIETPVPGTRIPPGRATPLWDARHIGSRLGGSRPRRGMREVGGWLLLGALGVFALACSGAGVDPSPVEDAGPSPVVDAGPSPVVDAGPSPSPDAAPDADERCQSDDQCPDGMWCSPEGCIAATCTDGVHNGAESDIDCGGDCPPCDEGRACEMPDDCQSGVCSDFICAPASCTDLVRNGEETDVDCGGSECGRRCDDAEQCEQASDCVAGACVDGRCASQASCDVLRQVSPEMPSGTYTIEPDGVEQPFPVYCEMTGSEGWTLVLKIDGAGQNFLYDSPLWTNTEALGSSTADLTPEEAKSPAFWTVPMTQVRVVMRDEDTDRDLTVSFDPALGTEITLNTLFAGSYRRTNNERNEWLGLVSSGSLQTGCQQQGLNNEVTGRTPQKLRLGIFGNQKTENDCLSCDSYLGIGHSSRASGNVASAQFDDSGARGRDTRTFSFVFVR